jgi:hypothetical protein
MADIANDRKNLVSMALPLSPDVIVAEITTPILAAVRAVHEPREAGLATTLMFLTIHGGGEFLQACLEEGVVGYELSLT